MLSPLDIAEADDFLFDFTSRAPVGDVILSVEKSVDLERGAPDADAQSMLIGDHTIGHIDADEVFVPGADGFVVMQRVSAAGRVLRNTYCLRITAVLLSGLRLTAAAHVTVKRL